jgi:subtilisin family serine protease
MVALAVIALAPDALLSQGRQPATRRVVMLDGREVVEGEVIVRYRSQTGALERQRAEYQADSDSSEPLGRHGMRRVRSRNMTTRELIETLSANPDVELVEPNYIIRASSMPNDPAFASQWGLHNTGQNVDGQAGVPGADIDAAAAWDITTGSRANIVAVLDTGIDFNHPDLAANVFSAPRAFTVTLGSVTVSCGAGTHGFNALTNLCVPFDDNGHGTHVSGIIGAVGNNGTGVSGVNWTANVMALKVLGSDGTGTTSDAIKAIDFAIQAKSALGADANIRVLNASWGGPTFSQALDDEIQAANNADMLFVAAAGTNSRDTDVAPHYPASSTRSNVISVAAVDNTGALAPFSNYGATTVDLGAPGASTLSTLPNSSYGELSGTSMSAPFVSGAAALVLSVCPSNTATLKSRLLASVDPVASMTGKVATGGSLNVNNAITQCRGSVATITVNGSSTAIAAQFGSTLTVQINNGPGNPSDWVGLFAVGAADSEALQWKYLNGQQTQPSSGLTSATLTFQTPLSAGNYEMRMYAKGWVRLATSATITATSLPQLSINDVSVTEGNSGTRLATFTVSLNPVSSSTVTVTYSTADGSATTANADYVGKSGSLIFSPSVATRTIDIVINGDTAVEPSETFTINLSSPSNAAIADGQGVGTIITDEGSTSPTITTPATVAPGGTITAQLSNGPGNTTDWMGLFAIGAADSQALEWKYLNGTQTQPSTGISNATLSFTAPSTQGNYEVRLYAKGWVRLATSATIAVTSGSSSSATVTAPSSVNPGASFQAVVSNGPGNTTDWAGLFAVGAADSQALQWKYLNGTQTQPATGISNATLQFTAPSATGNYEIRLYAKGFVRLATSGNIAVGSSSSGSAQLTASPSTVKPGNTIQVGVSNSPGNATDWVGLFVVGSADSAALQWQYLNGSQSQPATGMTSATLYFTAPGQTGNYEVRLYGKGFVRLATSGTITVVP